MRKNWLEKLFDSYDAWMEKHDDFLCDGQMLLEFGLYPGIGVSCILIAVLLGGFAYLLLSVPIVEIALFGYSCKYDLKCRAEALECILSN